MSVNGIANVVCFAKVHHATNWKQLEKLALNLCKCLIVLIQKRLYLCVSVLEISSLLEFCRSDTAWSLILYFYVYINKLIGFESNS